MSNVDGIKKKSSAELVKKRELVLEVINKETAVQKTFSQQPIKKFDDVQIKKVDIAAEKVPTMSSLLTFIGLIKKQFTVLLTTLKKLLVKFLYIIALSFFVTFIVYYLFLILVTSYRIDRPLFRFMEKHLPIPAIIVGYKYIGFYDYLDFKNKNIGKTEPEIRLQLIKNIITNNFLARYGVKDTSLLNGLIIRDNEVSSVGLSRIRKIKSLISGGADYDQIAGKYGEKRDSLSIATADFNKYEYRDQVKNLAVGQLSDVIFGNDGYYVFRCNEKNNEQISLSYVFVHAKNFDTYVNEIAAGIYYMSFVN